MKPINILFYLVVITFFSACIPTPGGGGVTPTPCNCSIDNFLIDQGTYYIPKDGITEIHNLVLHKPLYIYNQVNVATLKYTNLKVRNCRFENIDSSAAIRVSRANGIQIIKCTIRNISYADGISISNSHNVLIDSCTIDKVDYSGVNTEEEAADLNFLVGGAFNLTLKNCVIDSVALRNSSSVIGHNFGHGIYSKGRNAIIEDNIFSNILCPAGGNGISLRASGIVRYNTVFNTTASGIVYFSNYNGAGENALIENNVVYNSDSNGIHVDGYGTYCVDQLTIRFNTVIQNNISAATTVFRFNFLGFATPQLYIYGNLLYNPNISNIDDILTVNGSVQSNFHLENNYKTNANPGFVSIATNNFDLLNSVSASWSNSSNTPALDFNKETRSLPSDYGAYKF